MARYMKFIWIFGIFSSCFQVVFAQTVNFYSIEDLPVEQGSDVTFHCDVTGNPGIVGFHLPEYSKPLWMHFLSGNNCGYSEILNTSVVDFDATCTLITNTFRFSFKISSINEVFHNGNVICEVIYGGNNIVTKSIGLSINIPLDEVEIDVTENITIAENDAINITCSARSRPLSTIMWYISGEPIIDNHTIEINDTIINSTITYTGDRRHNNGRLYCKADRGNNEVESASVYLNVTYPPDISINPSGLPIEGTPSYNITCDVLDSNPYPDVFYWYRGMELVEGVSSGVYIFDSLNRTHSDNYTCYTKNSIGNSSMETIDIDVLYKGSILTFSTTNLTVSEGDTVTANTEVEGKPLPNVTWSNDRTSSIMLREDFTTNSSLNITTVCENTGNYTLAADNGLVEIDSRKFRIEVSCKPHPHVTSSAPTSVNSGGSFRLETTFIAYPLPSIRWYHRPNNTRTNTTLLSDSNIVISTESDEAVHTSTVDVERANSTHNGVFFVVVSNSMGEDVQMFYVSVTEPESSSPVKTEAIIGGVIGAVVFIILSACVVNCYRKKKRKEKEREIPWKTNSKDIDDIIKENPIEDVEHIEPAYVTNQAFQPNPKPTVQATPSTTSNNNVYAKVVKIQKPTVQVTNETISDRDDNTKF